jgi:hypothetical protein
MQMMKKTSLWIVSALLLIITGYATQSEAAVYVNLPAIRFAAPPEVVVIPGTYVYMIPNRDEDILFFQGYWWRPYEGRWYRASNYNGRWSYIGPSRVPGGLRGLPLDYRQRITPEHERIAHKDVRRNWKTWEKQKRWDRHDEQSRTQSRAERGDNDRGRVKQSEHDSGGYGDYGKRH